MLHRLTSKCLSCCVQADAARVLSPTQVGVGIKVGCEAIVHSVIHTSEDTDSRWCLQLDFRNAFNSIDRSCMFQEVCSHVPLLSRWIESCYGSHPLLFFCRSQSMWCPAGGLTGSSLFFPHPPCTQLWNVFVVKFLVWQ